MLISRGEEAEVVEHYARRRRLLFPVLIDRSRSVFDSGQFKNAKGQSGLPTNILLDSDHKIIFVDVGFNEEKLAKLKEAVDGVFDNPPPK